MIILLDTCIWLNFIEKKKLSVLLNNIEDFLNDDLIKIVMPDILKDEINKHLHKVKDKRISYFTSKLKGTRELKEIVRKDNLELFNKTIGLLEGDIQNNEESLTEDVRKIERILKHKNIINQNTSNNIRLKVFNLGLKQKCPFHTKHNFIADATILEIFFEYINAMHIKEKSFFISSDSHFVDKNNPKILHPDIQNRFDKNNCEFSLNIGEILNKIKTNSVDISIVKEIEERTNFLTEYIGRDVPNMCTECNTKLPQASYRQMYGFIGWLTVCPQCGKMYFEIDSDY